ncbi:MAG: HEPN domain-containing protein [Deltaproteobacteria bacterium]|nr:HEPN domain-containing protein [Deltaproteobacteria bacterium]MBI3294710.1 HEPN domain-containing protein [Deltaproteobacteria bacterium]
MSPDFRKFKPEYGQELFRIALADLESAQALLQSKRGRLENVLFLVEQAVEKSLKAVLCHEGKAIPLPHQLYAVLILFPANDLPPGGFGLNDLTPFATIRRYEEGKAIVTLEEAAQALTLATQVLAWSSRKLGLP